MHRPFALLAVLALSLLRAAVSAAAWTHDPSENLQMCSTFGNHLEPTISPDGAGGAYVAWTDQRALLSTGNDIYMQHITRDGTLDPAWPVNGLAIVTAPGDQVSPVSIPDGAGGVIVAWADHRAATWDVYAQRVLVNGVPAPGWPASGRLLGGHPTYDEIAPKIAGDGANGAYVVFTRIYSPGVDTDPILQRVLANGTVAPGFGPGVDLDNALSEQSQPAITADDSGGVVVAYRTNAAGNFDIKANRVAPNGVVMWAATLCNAAGDQTNPVIAGDGHNGAYVAWNDLRNPDQDVYVGHARGNGLILAPWPNGIDANAATGVDSVACVLPDVTGGVYVLWYRGQTTREAFAWHLDAGGQPPSFYSSPLDLGDASAGLAATADEFGEINVITGAVLPTLASKVVFTHAAAIYPGPSCVVSNVGSSVGQLALARRSGRSDRGVERRQKRRPVRHLRATHRETGGAREPRAGHHERPGRRERPGRAGPRELARELPGRGVQHDQRVPPMAPGAGHGGSARARERRGGARIRCGGHGGARLAARHERGGEAPGVAHLDSGGPGLLLGAGQLPGPCSLSRLQHGRPDDG